MAHNSLRNIVASRMRQLGVKSALHSTHALRHSCATELLRKGVSMDDIARFLGHRDNKSVTIYAKCSRASVRKVGDFSLDGIL
jgi:site-specific recombinase XerD